LRTARSPAVASINGGRHPGTHGRKEIANSLVTENRGSCPIDAKAGRYQGTYVAKELIEEIDRSSDLMIGSDAGISAVKLCKFDELSISWPLPDY
jgi:hypothetical protein